MLLYRAGTLPKFSLTNILWYYQNITVNFIWIAFIYSGLGFLNTFYFNFYLFLHFLLLLTLLLFLKPSDIHLFKIMASL